MNEAEQLLYKYYEEDNFEVVDIKNNKKHKRKICYVFFSSNGLYKDRNDIDIIKQMHETDRYEWKFISSNKKIIKNATRIIFVRDIFKIFYIRGINRDINTIDKICELIKNLTVGMDVIYAGSSAGSYMSLLVGNMLLNTKRIITLGGIADLESFRTFSSYLSDNLDKCNYIDITSFLYGDYWVVNFYGIKNEYDKHNGHLIELYSNKDKLINVGFDTETHAPRPSGDDLIRLLSCKDSHLATLHKKTISRNHFSETEFSNLNIGLIKTLFNSIKAKIVKVLKRR